ncbi:thioredoxin-like protein [Lichtheimia hyalospora FSU 10163]|nr:thioredoxin-like protein [Lichtheimia hyalospora FSU 10163]
MEDPLLAQFQKEVQQDDKHSDRGSGSDSEQEEANVEAVAASSYPTRQEGPQTGPKGVLADHAYYQKTQREVQAHQIAEYNARMLAKAPTTTTYLQDEAAKEFVIQQMNDEEDDDAAIRRYREKRLEELKRTSQRPPHDCVFGQVIDITVDEYPSTIDNENTLVSVAVHLYDESIPACRTLDDFWRELARKYAFAKFVRVSARELEFDLVGSPAVLGYKNGNLVANLVRFVDLVGTAFTEEAVENALLANGAITRNDIYRVDQSQISNSDDDDDD